MRGCQNPNAKQYKSAFLFRYQQRSCENLSTVFVISFRLSTTNNSRTTECLCVCVFFLLILMLCSFTKICEYILILVQIRRRQQCPLSTATHAPPPTSVSSLSSPNIS